MENEIERRIFTEFRLDDEKKSTVRGYAAVFNKLSEDLGGFREKIAPGTFANTLTADVRALFNHDANYVLGRTTNKSLRLSEDEKGLAIEIDLDPEVSYARDLMRNIEKGNVSQMSFGFRTIKDDWKKSSNKEMERTLLEVKLFDVSPVTFPAYPQTTVKVRDYLTALKETEQSGLPGPSDRGVASLVKARFFLR